MISERDLEIAVVVARETDAVVRQEPHRGKGNVIRCMLVSVRIY